MIGKSKDQRHTCICRDNIPDQGIYLLSVRYKTSSIGSGFVGIVNKGKDTKKSMKGEGSWAIDTKGNVYLNGNALKD